MQPSDLGAAVLTRKNLRQQLVEMYPGIEEDETALMDSLDGLDDFNEQVLATLRAAIEREAFAAALGEMIGTYTERKRRLEDGAKTLRLAVLHAMSEAGVRTIPAADMTVSVGRGKPRLIITDEAAVPDEFCKFERKPDKTAIAAAMRKREGLQPTWATFGNTPSILTIHRR